jgi:hypothetical protein
VAEARFAEEQGLGVTQSFAHLRGGLRCGVSLVLLPFAAEGRRERIVKAKRREFGFGIACL